MGYRHRRMYYATGMPGWMRFGYSPGWLGRSPTGLPPTAQRIASSGALPQYQEYLGVPPAPATAPWMLGTASLTKEQERQMLEQQARDMELQIADVKRRLDEVRSGRQTPQPQQYGYPAMAYPYSAEFYGASPYDYAPIPTAPPSAEAELASLEEYWKYLGEEVKGVQEKIDELKKQTTRAKSETDETTRKGGE